MPKRRKGSEQAEADHRQHGQDAEAERRQAEIVFDVGDEQRNGGDGGPQIEGDQEHCGDHPPRISQQHRRRRRILRASSGYWALGIFRRRLINAGIHRSLLGATADPAIEILE